MTQASTTRLEELEQRVDKEIDDLKATVSFLAEIVQKDAWNSDTADRHYAVLTRASKKAKRIQNEHVALDYKEFAEAFECTDGNAHREMDRMSKRVPGVGYQEREGRSNRLVVHFPDVKLQEWIDFYHKSDLGGSYLRNEDDGDSSGGV